MYVLDNQNVLYKNYRIALYYLRFVYLHEQQDGPKGVDQLKERCVSHSEISNFYVMYYL